jgi:hypothetical protein
MEEHPVARSLVGVSYRLSERTMRRRLKFYGISMRAVTTSRRALPDDWMAQQELLRKRLADLVYNSPLLTAEERGMGVIIPPELCINFDQTGLKLASSLGRTLARRGAKVVEATSAGDKRQCTGVTASSAAGEILPVQVCALLTPRCTPTRN